MAKPNALTYGIGAYKMRNWTRWGGGGAMDRISSSAMELDILRAHCSAWSWTEMWTNWLDFIRLFDQKVLASSLSWRGKRGSYVMRNNLQTNMRLGGCRGVFVYVFVEAYWWSGMADDALIPFTSARSWQKLSNCLTCTWQIGEFVKILISIPALVIVVKRFRNREQNYQNH